MSRMGNEGVRLTRRALLSLAGAGAYALLGACQQPTSPVRPSDSRAVLPTPEPKPTQPPTPTAKPSAEGKLGESKLAAQAAPVTGPPKPGGSVVWAAEVDPVTLDPLAGAGPAASQVWADLTYQSLVMLDESLKLLPGLAEAWVNTSPTTWTFKLRQGVRFHDGSEFEAEDVKAWYERLMAPSTTTPEKAWFSPIAGVQPRGKYEVEVMLRESYAPFLATFAGLRGSALAPRGWLQLAGAGVKSSTVGSGPFKIAEHVPGSHVRYVKYADYWEKGLPYLDEVVLKIIPDEQARVAALRAGEVTYARVGPAAAQSLKNEKSLTVLSSPGPTQLVTRFNTVRKPLDDARVRQAIGLAVDRRQAVDRLLGGEGRLTGPVPTGHGTWAIPPESLPYRTDLAAAKRLMAEADLQDGFEATVKAAADQPLAASLATLLDEQVRALGVSLRVERADRPAFQKALDARDFDLAVTSVDFLPDPAYYLAPYASMGPGSGAGMPSGWANPRYDEDVQQAGTALDPGQRKLLYDGAQHILLNEVPAIWWLTQNTLEVVHTSVKGYVPSFTGGRSGLKKVWLER